MRRKSKPAPCFHRTDPTAEPYEMEKNYPEEKSKKEKKTFPVEFVMATRGDMSSSPFLYHR